MSDDSDEPAAIEEAFGFIVIWSAASTATAAGYAHGYPFDYFTVLALALWTSSALLVYHHRETILEDLRAAWNSEPADPDDVIDDVVDDDQEGSA